MSLSCLKPSSFLEQPDMKSKHLTLVRRSLGELWLPPPLLPCLVCLLPPRLLIKLLPASFCPWETPSEFASQGLYICCFFFLGHSSPDLCKPAFFPLIKGNRILSGIFLVVQEFPLNPRNEDKEALSIHRLK